MLTLEDIARETGHCRQTVSGWASEKRPAARRLRVMRLGHRTVRVRPVEWEKFKQRNEF